MRLFLSALLCSLTVGAAQVPGLNESFTGTTFPPEMWSVYNQDGGVRRWTRSTTKYRTPPAVAAVSSESRSLRNDDWLVTRRLLPVPGDDVLTFWLRSHNTAKRESIEVWVSTSGPTPPEFNTRIAAFGVASATYRQNEVSLATFDSTPVYVGIRCVSLGKRVLYVDDISGPRYIPGDAGPTAIRAPRPYEPPDTTIHPNIVVKNYGSATQGGFPVRIIITNTLSGDTVYRSAVSADTIAPQESVEVQFTEGWFTAEGTYLVTAITALAGDLEPRNDTSRRLVRVVAGPVHDVAAREILQPIGLVQPGQHLPRVLTENLGNASEQFPTTLEIFRNQVLVFADTVTRLVPAGDLDTVDFRVWMANPGLYLLRAITRLSGDMNPANDTQTAVVEVLNLIHDVGVGKIIAPPETVGQGETVRPAAVVANFGDYAETFTTRFLIGAGYQDTFRTSLLPEAEETLYFAGWIASPPGLLFVASYTMLPGDGEPGNDTARTTVFVSPPQGATETEIGPRINLNVHLLTRRRFVAEYEVPLGAAATLRILDPCGRVIISRRVTGTHHIVFTELASGAYIVQLSVPGTQARCKTVVY